MTLEDLERSERKFKLIVLIVGIVLLLAGVFWWLLKDYIAIHSKPVYVPEKALAYVPNLGFLPVVDNLLWLLFVLGICLVTMITGMYLFEKIKNHLAKRKLIKKLLSR